MRNNSLNKNNELKGQQLQANKAQISSSLRGGVEFYHTSSVAAPCFHLRVHQSFLYPIGPTFFRAQLRLGLCPFATQPARARFGFRLLSEPDPMRAAEPFHTSPQRLLCHTFTHQHVFCPFMMTFLFMSSNNIFRCAKTSPEIPLGAAGRNGGTHCTHLANGLGLIQFPFSTPWDMSHIFRKPSWEAYFWELKVVAEPPFCILLCRTEPHSCFPNFTHGSINSMGIVC